MISVYFWMEWRHIDDYVCGWWTNIDFEKSVMINMGNLKQREKKWRLLGYPLSRLGGPWTSSWSNTVNSNMRCKTCTSLNMPFEKKALWQVVSLCFCWFGKKHIFVAGCVFKVLFFCRLSILSRPWLRFHQKILLACSKDSWSDGVGMCLPCNPIPAKGFHPNTTVGHASPDCPWVFFLTYVFMFIQKKWGKCSSNLTMRIFFQMGWLVGSTTNDCRSL